MDRNRLIEELACIVGKEDVLSSRRDLLVYEYDATPDVSMPEVVVFPRDATEVSAVMRLAHREGMAVTPRGAGTNLSGGTVPLQGGIVVVLTRMNRVLEIDVASQRAVLEPGVINLELQGMLAPLGYLFAPDPSSQKVTTLGGNVGENAGGPHCFKYGITTNHVYGLEVVLADGEIVHTGGTVEDCPGYDLTGLLVGSEGTLGVVTSAIVRLERAPEAVKTMLAIFDTLEDCGNSVSDTIAAGIIPATLEIMDKPLIAEVEAATKVGFPLDAEAVLLIELDGLKDELERQSEQMVEICRRNHVRSIQVARDDAERDQLWLGRRVAYSAWVKLSMGSAVHDTTVPRTKLAETLRRIRTIADEHRIKLCTAAHAGDGNLHPLVVYDPRDEDELERVQRANREIVALCVEMGGTLSGEHGIGIEKRDYMPMLFDDDELGHMRQIKRLFDPDDIMNPGKLLPF
ncbi:MAG: FAD-binding oxidoreductase [Chloroflexota bacterium]